MWSMESYSSAPTQANKSDYNGLGLDLNRVDGAPEIQHLWVLQEAEPEELKELEAFFYHFR